MPAARTLLPQLTQGSATMIGHVSTIIIDMIEHEPCGASVTSPCWQQNTGPQGVADPERAPAV